MSTEDTSPKINPGDSILWPMLKLDYKTSPDKIAALLPPGIEVGEGSQAHLTVYNFPVPDIPEFGILVTVDADFNGEQGMYALGYGIDQESAIFISRDRNGQPKYPCEVDYYRMMNKVSAKCTHQGYTFLEYEGEVVETLPNPEPHKEVEWWVKVSAGVGMMPSGNYDFPPHVVRVESSYGTAFNQRLDGKLTLRDSPWDPVKELLPQEGDVSARLWTMEFRGRDITLAGKLDADAFGPYLDTIGGSRWLGENGAPKRAA